MRTGFFALFLGCAALSCLPPSTDPAATGTVDTVYIGTETSLDLADADLYDVSFLANLPELTWLRLRGNNKVRDISPLSSSPKLTFLDLAHCDVDGVGLLAGLTELRELFLEGNRNLRSIAPLAACTKLERLRLNNCALLKDVSPLGGLTSLRELNLASCESITDTRPLAGCIALESLIVERCYSLVQLPDINAFPGLKVLKAARCTSLVAMPALARMQQLETVDLSFCRSLRGSISLSGLQKLQKLELTNSNFIAGVILENLPFLKEIGIGDCDSLSTVSLRALPRVEELFFRGHSYMGKGVVSELRTIYISEMEGLKKLHIASCPRLETISLAGVNNLTSLEMRAVNPNLDMSFLSAVPRMKNISISYSATKNLDYLKLAPELDSLDVSRCDSLSDLSSVGKLSQLSLLVISECPRIADISPLAACPRLDRVAIYRCDGFKSVSLQAPWLGLRHLRISGASLENVNSLEGLKHLEKLEVNSNALKSISGIDGCTQLKTVVLEAPVKDISAIGTLPGLTHIQLIKCNSILDFSPLESVLQNGDTLTLMSMEAPDTIRASLSSAGVMIRDW